jgi:hypothetical protein
MGKFIQKLLGIKQQGPSDAEKAAQADAAQRAREKAAEADRLAALSQRIASRRQSLAFRDKLGG